MKIRKDFVTNSSSSSFIIGKTVENPNVDMVFNIVKQFYAEYLEKRDKLQLDCYTFGMYYNKKTNSFKFNKGESWDSDNQKIDNLVKKQYGINSWDYFFAEYGWMRCKTYKEYEQYWVEKINDEKLVNVHAPFSIVDFSSTDNSYFVHHGKSGIENINNFSHREYSDILGWYYPCAESFLSNEDDDDYDCDYCENKKDSERCKKVNDMMKSKELTYNNALILLLGKICICSECSYIHDYVVDKLYNISDYACNHMG